MVFWHDFGEFAAQGRSSELRRIQIREREHEPARA
jgi:hypothetical protein